MIEGTEGIHQPPIKDSELTMLSEAQNKLAELKKHLREVPQKRNFDIEIKDSESKISFVLKNKKTGKEKDLNTFLPQGNYFIKDKEFVYHPGKKQVGFPENELPFRGFLLSLFHEIGHAHQKKEHNVISRIDSIKAAPAFIINLIKMSSNVGSRRISEDDMIDILEGGMLLPQWLIDKTALSKSVFERNAWTFALKELRNLQKEGYNVFEGFKNAKEIKAYIAYNLVTYDIGHSFRKLSAALLTLDKTALQELMQKENSLFFSKGKHPSNKTT